jgi:hypothetical protein
METKDWYYWRMCQSGIKSGDDSGVFFRGPSPSTGREELAGTPLRMHPALSDGIEFQVLSGFAPFRVSPFGCSCSFRTSFPLQLLSCTLGLVLTTSASTVSSASLVLALLLIGLVVNLSFILSPLSLIISYLILLSYLIVSLFIVWTMVAPATPSHSVLVLSFVPNTGKHGPCAGLCADRLGI